MRLGGLQCKRSPHQRRSHCRAYLGAISEPSGPAIHSRGRQDQGRYRRGAGRACSLCQIYRTPLSALMAVTEPISLMRTAF